mmetsp:Transcript_39940/g.52253  ORF Transcript_39940/g.52253 Transcript_39940/m.52253 type:complete len:82 (+) Transcript_39940:112-357(+)
MLVRELVGAGLADVATIGADGHNILTYGHAEPVMHFLAVLVALEGTAFGLVSFLEVDVGATSQFRILIEVQLYESWQTSGD